ncbi:MAG: mycothiol synthase [Propionibacteriaceae bacterium]|nr:mycothiol synthase [Propionibacteriaceae bacterium]
MSSAFRLDRSVVADPALSRQVEALAAAALAADCVSPLNDQAALVLAGRAGGATHLALRRSGRLLGYAQLDDDHSVQLVVDPTWRRQGLGRRLVEAVRQADAAAEFWSFGDLPAARALAAALGLRPVRQLWRLTRSVAGLPPWSAQLPAGCSLRAFQPGDEAALLALNARAFRQHPEQGRWTMADFEARRATAWFDPADLLLAWGDDGRLAGFHWTKRHDAATGEVYVLAVDPDRSGSGLGRALLQAGLAHLAERGVGEVFLYVEGDNGRVVHLYESSGFCVSLRDIRYAAEGKEGT